MWLKNLTGQKYSNSTLEQAKTFFGSFDGDHKKFHLWREHFMREHKQLKQGIHTQLMKACGGTGSHFDIPPTDFLPHSMTVGDKCTQCNARFNSDATLNEHIKNSHKDHVKRAYSKEALEMVLKDPKYVDWLNKTLVTEGRKAIAISQIQESNKLLVEKLNSQNKNRYTLVKDNNGVSEMKKDHITTKEDGTIKISVITEQFINVTSRKRAVSNEETANTNTEKHKSMKVRNIVKHVAGENSEKQARIVAKYLDGEGPTFAAAVSKQSKHLNEQKKFTAEETAAITGLVPDSTMDKMRTAHNNKFGSTPFASRHKVEKVRKEILIVSRDDWEASEHDLYIHKQGNSVNEKKKTTVFTVRNMKTYIEKHAESEKDNLKHLKDMEEIMVCYDGDGGGGRFVCEFAFLNNIDRKVKLHPILIYEGTDTRPNLEVTLGKLTPQIKKLEGEIIIVGGRRLKIHQVGVFDLSALNTILGKQGHSATFFDAWTDVRLSHIRNHSGNSHTRDNCKDINFLSLEDFDKFYTHHSVETLASSSAAKFGSIVANNLLPLQDIYHYIPPVMHRVAKCHRYLCIKNSQNFGIIFLSLLHLGTLTIPIQNLKCPKNAFLGDLRF